MAYTRDFCVFGRIFSVYGGKVLQISTLMALVLGSPIFFHAVSLASWHPDHGISHDVFNEITPPQQWSQGSLGEITSGVPALTSSTMPYGYDGDDRPLLFAQIAQNEPIPTFSNSFEQQNDAPRAPDTLQQNGRQSLTQQQPQETLNVLLEQVLLINQRLTSIEQQLSQLKQENTSGALATPTQQLPIVDAQSVTPSNLGTLSAQQPSTVDSVERENQAKTQYSEALELLRKRKFSDAEQALKTFINVHQDSSLLSNAQYWLGETFYAQNQFEEAIKVFLSSLELNPNSNKANDILLKLGLSFKALSRKDKACESFAPLIYGSRNPAIYISDRAKIESLGLGCPQ